MKAASPDRVKTRTDLPATTERESQERKRWVEPVAALLMALATLSTAWCSFESAAWTRKSNRLMNEFNTLERKAGLLTMQGTQQATIHAAMFMQVLAAQQAGKDRGIRHGDRQHDLDQPAVQPGDDADREQDARNGQQDVDDPHEHRVDLAAHRAGDRPHDAWIAQRPFENPSADPHPFVPKLYEPRGTREAADATAKAATNQQKAGDAGSISGQYLANTVLFATVLFFASASGKFEQRRVRLVAFSFAAAVFIFAVVRTAMLPI